MTDKKFKAFVVDEQGDNQFAGAVREKFQSELPQGEVRIRVYYSALNYKDALSAKGNRGVTKRYPHTPGIDAAGVVEYSEDPEFKPGAEVVVTSYDLGMNTPGGFGQYISVPADWVVKLPSGLGLKEAMIIGTAGLTAAMAVNKIEERIDPEQGEILVTGATGGVGSFAIAMLSRAGYLVGAVTSKTEQAGYLEKLGADRVIPRNTMEKAVNSPMLKAQWPGAIDTTGGVVLENVIKGTKSQGVVACLGNAASPELHLTVFPFILRGITLAGIDSQNYPIGERRNLWKKLAHDWKPKQLLDFYKEITPEELQAYIDQMIAGKLTGRIIVNMQEEAGAND